MKQNDTIGIDAPRVTRDEALELMVHHLRLAAMYFEAVPKDDDANAAEIVRIMIGQDDHDRATAPALMFYKTIRDFYEEMKSRD